MDRRTIWAILLMMVIAIAPGFLLKPHARPAPPRLGRWSDPAPAAPRCRRPLRAPPGSTAPTPAAAAPRTADSGVAADTVHVVAPALPYGISTRGGRLVGAAAPAVPVAWRRRGPMAAVPSSCRRESDLLGL